MGSEGRGVPGCQRPCQVPGVPSGPSWGDLLGQAVVFVCPIATNLTPRTVSNQYADLWPLFVKRCWENQLSEPLRGYTGEILPKSSTTYEFHPRNLSFKKIKRWYQNISRKFCHWTCYIGVVFVMNGPSWLFPPYIWNCINVLNLTAITCCSWLHFDTPWYFTGSPPDKWQGFLVWKLNNDKLGLV